MKMRRTVWLVLGALLAASLACNLSSSGAPELPGAEGGAEANPTLAPQGQSGPEDPSDQGQQAQGGGAQAGQGPIPVSLNSGLATLNSYRMVQQIETTGPTEIDRSSTTIQVEYDEASDATYTRSESTNQDADVPEGQTEVAEYYQIGDQACNVSDGEVEFEEVSPIEREMRDLLTSAYDINPIIENPEFVGEEQVNGVATEHYRFQVTSLGSSGAEVTRSDGEYWVATDGRYLVRYSLQIAMRDAPEGTEGAEAFEASAEIEVSDINMPISIQFSQACLEAQANPEEAE